MTKYDIIFFDAGNTLIHPHPSFEEGIHACLREEGHDLALETVREAAYAALNDALRQIADGRRYCISDAADAEFWTETYAAMLHRLSFDGDARPLGLRVYRFWQGDNSFALFPDVADTLASLAAAGARMGLLSNFGSHLEHILKHLDVWKYFDPPVISAHVNCQKPEAEIFCVALDKAGVLAARAALVGDNPVDDVQGGLQAGITPILIDRDDRFPHHTSCPRITRMTELPGIVLG